MHGVCACCMFCGWVSEYKCAHEANKPSNANRRDCFLGRKLIPLQQTRTQRRTHARETHSNTHVAHTSHISHIFGHLYNAERMEVRRGTEYIYIYLVICSLDTERSDGRSLVRWADKSCERFARQQLNRVNIILKEFYSIGEWMQCVCMCGYILNYIRLLQTTVGSKSDGTLVISDKNSQNWYDIHYSQLVLKISLQIAYSHLRPSTYRT